MKRKLSFAVALANVLFVLILAISADALLARVDPVGWIHRPQGVLAIERASMAAFVAVLGAIPCLTLLLALVDYARGFRREALLASGVSALLLLVLVLWVGGGDVLVSLPAAHADRLWAQALEPMDAFLARHPHAPESQAAGKLRVIATRMGVDMATLDGSWTSGPTGGGVRPSVKLERQTLEGLRRGLWAYVSAQVRRADDAVDPPPPELADWLARHEAEVDAFESQARSADRIAFETDWSGVRRPIPNVPGTKDVICILLLRALARERLDDSRAADQSIDAAWGIGAALRDRGESLSQLMSDSADSLVLGVLRKLREPDQSWRARLAEHDYRLSMLRAFQGEAWTRSAEMRRLTAVDEMRRHTRNLWLRIQAPPMMWMAADSSAVLAGAVAELRTADPCQVGAPALEERIEGALARWNFIGRMALKDKAGLWSIAARAALDAELTARILDARAIRKERGDWPAEITDPTSGVCRGSRWLYVREGTGMTLKLAPDPGLGDPVVFRASLR